MSNSPRDNIKKQIDQMLNHVNTIQETLVLLGEIYREYHPDYTENYKVVFAFFTQAKELLQGLRDVA